MGMAARTAYTEAEGVLVVPFSFGRSCPLLAVGAQEVVMGEALIPEEAQKDTSALTHTGVPIVFHRTRPL